MSISTGFTGKSSGEASDVPNANKTAEVIKWLSTQSTHQSVKKWYNVICNPKEGELDMLDGISQSLVNMTSKFGKGDLDKGVVFDTQTAKAV